MPESAHPVCFTCGLSAGETIQFNRLPNGQVCPTCRERLLDLIPPCLPSLRVHVVEMGFGEPVAEESRREDDFDAGSRPWPPAGHAS